MKKSQWIRTGISGSIFMVFFLFLFSIQAQEIHECKDWEQKHPEWIFCDDFEEVGNAPMVRVGRYFEYNNDEGDFIPVRGLGIGNSIGMRTIFQKGEVDAGSLKLGFGRNPSGYMNKGIRDTDDFREVYYRMYLKNDPEWEGNPAKLSKATVISSSSWSQAMIAHLWSDSKYHLLLDPASGVDTDGNVVTTNYNDFNNLKWLGNQAGTTPIFDGTFDEWICIEHHIKLNDPGEKNGIQEFWINGNLEARLTNLDFVGTYNAYALNAIFIENYWNNGSLKLQERYFDNIVISTERIGCLDLSTDAGNEKLFNIHVYPNPTIGKIDYYCTNQTKQEVKVLDVAGNVLINLQNDKQRGSVDISHLKRGMFFLNITSDKNIFTCKIIKE